MPLGENIRKVRKQKGWTQRELAEKIHSDASYINRVEIGKANPSIAVLERIADALEASLDYLVKGIIKSDGIITSEFNPVDKALVERVKLIDSLEEKDRNVLTHLIDTMLTKKRMRELLDEGYSRTISNS